MTRTLAQLVLTSDGIFLQTGLEGIKLTQLGFIREAVLQLAERGQQSCSVCLQLPILTAQTEFNGEPEALEDRMYMLFITTLCK